MHEEDEKRFLVTVIKVCILFCYTCTVKPVMPGQPYTHENCPEVVGVLSLQQTFALTNVKTTYPVLTDCAIIAGVVHGSYHCRRCSLQIN